MRFHLRSAILWDLANSGAMKTLENQAEIEIMQLGCRTQSWVLFKMPDTVGQRPPETAKVHRIGRRALFLPSRAKRWPCQRGLRRIPQTKASADQSGGKRDCPFAKD